MPVNYLYPDYEIIRNKDNCIGCQVCARQCANEAHWYDEELGAMRCDSAKCVNCHRCVSLCPTRALKIVKTDHTFRENANWAGANIQEIYRQAESGGVLLSSMGNPKPYPVYWDKLLINASQVTNPSIDPLREPMETKTFLGKKPEDIQRDEQGRIKPNLQPQLVLSMPVMFSAMSYGSISYNAHASLAKAAGNWAFSITRARADCMKISTNTAKTPSYRWLRGGSAYIKIIWKRARRLKLKSDRVQNRALADTCRAPKLWATFPKQE